MGAPTKRQKYTHKLLQQICLAFQTKQPRPILFPFERTGPLGGCPARVARRGWAGGGRERGATKTRSAEIDETASVIIESVPSRGPMRLESQMTRPVSSPMPKGTGILSSPRLPCSQLIKMSRATHHFLYSSTIAFGLILGPVFSFLLGYADPYPSSNYSLVRDANKKNRLSPTLTSPRRCPRTLL